MTSFVLLIDAGYLFKASLRLEKKTGRKLDYFKLVYELQRICKCEFKEKYYFNSVADNERNEQVKFHTWLKMAPPNGPKFKLELFPLKDFTLNYEGKRITTKVQKGVDVGIATRMLELVYEGLCDNIFLISGDGDFKSALKAVLRQKKGVYVAGFNDNSVSADLQEQATEIIWLDAYWSNISSDTQTVLPSVLPDDGEEVQAQAYKPPYQATEAQNQGGKKKKNRGGKFRGYGRPLLEEPSAPVPIVSPTTPPHATNLPTSFSSSSISPTLPSFAQVLLNPIGNQSMVTSNQQSAGPVRLEPSTTVQLETLTLSPINTIKTASSASPSSTVTSLPCTTPPPTPLPAHLQPPLQPAWACDVCTFASNAADLTHCEVCNSVKLVPNEWSCQVCTFKNPVSASCCTICETPAKTE